MTQLLRSLQWRQKRRALRAIELLVLDVDGVLTDGGLWFDPNGQLQKRFDVRDGLGIRLLQQAGLQLAFLSGGSGGATRCAQSNWASNTAWSASKTNQPHLQQLQAQVGASIASTAFVGDDLNDLAVRHRVGLLVTPADACPAVQRQADGVLKHSRGPWSCQRIGRADPASPRALG